MPKVHFTSPLDDVTVDVAPGTSLLEAAEACGAQVGHSCGGVCACSTCHVWVKKGLESFPGLAHRQELVATLHGVRYINDSKATNADATEKALAPTVGWWRFSGFGPRATLIGPRKA